MTLSMKFPELKIIDKVTNDDANREVKELLVVQLDWSEMDNHKIKSRKDWYVKHGLTKPTKEESKALKQLLDEVDWSGEYLYPTEYKYIFDKYSQFKISQHYYDECQYLMKAAKDDWERSRPFDTNVRETLLEASIKYVELFFYMIADAIYIYNREFRPLGIQDEVINFEQLILIRSLSLFRFWKFQTGGGVVVDRASDFTKKWRHNGQFEKEVKPTLEKNMEFEPMCLSRYYPEREEELKVLVNQRVRDNRLNNILN
jgi:hypothetical protein